MILKYFKTKFNKELICNVRVLNIDIHTTTTAVTKQMHDSKYSCTHVLIKIFPTGRKFTAKIRLTNLG